MRPTREQAFLELMRRGELSSGEISRFKEAAAAELKKREKPTPSINPLRDIEALPEADVSPPTAEALMTVGRPVLEYGGLTGGAIAGEAAGPLGSVAGAGLGYGMGKKATDIIEQYAGIQKPKPLAQEMIGSAEDVATGATMEMGGQIFGKLVTSYGVPAAKKLGQVVEKGIAKAIRPSAALQKTAGQTKIYYQRAKDAVLSIIANKNNLRLKDAEGNIVSGLPKTLSQFSEAIAQTKKEIFQQYNALAQAAGEEGLTVSLKPAVDELKSLIESKPFQDNAPNALKYAKTKIKKLSARKFYTAEQAQEAIAILNQKLKTFYKNSTLETAGSAYVDSIVAKNLRNSLDAGIESITASQYQELKNLYGALTHIERDVARRATVDARKNIKGLIDFSDMFTGYEVLSGIFRAEPSRMAAGAGARWMKTRIKWINDPNRIVQNLFQDAEKIIMKKGVPTPKAAKELVGRTGAYIVGRENRE